MNYSNNRIASCSYDEIKKWTNEPPFINNKPIKVLEGHPRGVYSLLYIKERDMMISGADDTLLLLWNMSTYQCETVIEGVHCCSPNSL